MSHLWSGLHLWPSSGWTSCPGWLGAANSLQTTGGPRILSHQTQDNYPFLLRVARQFRGAMTGTLYSNKQTDVKIYLGRDQREHVCFLGVRSARGLNFVTWFMRLVIFYTEQNTIILAMYVRTWEWNEVGWMFCKTYKIFYSRAFLWHVRIAWTIKCDAGTSLRIFSVFDFGWKGLPSRAGLGFARQAVKFSCQTSCSCVWRTRTLTLFPDLFTIHLRQNLKYLFFRVRSEWGFS